MATYRSAFPALLLFLAPVTFGCSPLEPPVETFEIRAHSLDQSETCAVVANPDLRIEALGPFPVSARSAEVLRYETPEQSLTFPDDTEGVTAAALDSTWLGYSDRRTKQGIDVLLWRERVGCTLFDPTAQEDPDQRGYPGPNSGQAIGYSPAAGVVLVAGGDESDRAAQRSLVFHAGDGASGLVPDTLNFPQARAYATVTPFGSGLLLAGGEDTINDMPGARTARQTAAVFDSELGGFENDLIELEAARTRHAAVTLESGETLLVGGARHTGGGTRVVVAPLEALSPQTRRTRIGAELSTGRLEPVALRLSDGNVLVGGGYNIELNPVTTVEWFSPDGASEVTPGTCSAPPCAVLAPRYHRAFAAMPGGGALTVGGCEPGAQTPACVDACGENFGCPAPDFNATWITPEGELAPIWLEPPLTACPGVAPGTPFSPERVWLASGSDGAPWLIAFDEDLEPPCRAAFRFEPWADPPQRVVPDDCAERPGDEDCKPYGGAFVATALDLEGSLPDPRTGLTSLGPDAFVWLTADDPPRLAGVRAGVRGALSQNETLLVTDPSAPLVPLHLGPHRPPGGAVSTAPKAIYSPQGRLILEAENDAGPAVGVSITDTRYGDVTLTIGYSGSGAPVVLFDRYEVGGDDCAWPSDPATPLSVVRRGSTITTSDGEGRSVRCKGAPTAAVGLALRAGGSTTTITSLGVKRD